jgi:hypothetical protein
MVALAAPPASSGSVSLEAGRDAASTAGKDALRPMRPSLLRSSGPPAVLQDLEFRTAKQLFCQNELVLKRRKKGVALHHPVD